MKTRNAGLLLLALMVAGAVGVGLALQARGPGAGRPSPRRAAGAVAEDWSWVDRLTNADAATRRRLLRCVKSAERHFRAIRSLSFDFALTRQEPAGGDPARPALETLTYRGKLYWKDGAVRYDFEGDRPSVLPDDRGRPRPRGKGLYSVVRTDQMAAAIEDSAFWGAVLNVGAPPASVDAWEQRPSCLTHLDPWVHYAACLREGPRRLAEVFGAARSITSREDGEGLHLRLVRDDGSWVEIICDPASGDLPVRSRAGGVRDERPVAHVGTEDRWQEVGGVWYPARHVELAFDGAGSSFRVYDWEVRNLRVNDGAEVPEAAFTLGDMPLPEGHGGSDFRASPPTELIKAQGLVRPRRPTERPVRGALASSPAPGAAPAPEPEPARGAKARYLALVAESEAARRAADASAMAAGPGVGFEERMAALAGVEARFAGRFLDLAAEAPGDPVAVDALGGVLLNRFTPGASGRAAEVLVRDHLGERGVRAALPATGRRAAGPLLGRGGVPARQPGRGPRRRAAGAGAPEPRLAAEEPRRGDPRTAGAGPRPASPVHGQGQRVRPARRGARGRAGAAGTRGGATLRGRGGAIRGGPGGAKADRRGGPGRAVSAPGAGRGQGRARGRGGGRRRQAVPIERLPGAGRGPDVLGELVRALPGDVPARARPREAARGAAVLAAVGRHGRGAGHAPGGDPIGRDHLAVLVEGGEDRPNCARYRVEQFPTTYVLDADGIIRARGVRGKAIDEVVDGLLGRD